MEVINRILHNTQHTLLIKKELDAVAEKTRSVALQSLAYARDIWTN